MNMELEAFMRREIVDQMTTCYAYTDLAKIENSGLSKETEAILSKLEAQMIETTNMMNKVE